MHKSPSTGAPPWRRPPKLLEPRLARTKPRSPRGRQRCSHWEQPSWGKELGSFYRINGQGADAPVDVVRRHAAGAESATGLLFTVLGEFVLPSAGSAWTATFIEVLLRLGVKGEPPGADEDRQRLVGAAPRGASLVPDKARRITPGRGHRVDFPLYRPGQRLGRPLAGGAGSGAWGPPRAANATKAKLREAAFVALSPQNCTERDKGRLRTICLCRVERGPGALRTRPGG